MVVHVSGRNLAAVVDAINDARCTIITAYDAQMFDAPAEGEAVIEQVEFEGGKVMEELASRLLAGD
jgi:hypothetical protein